MQHKSSINNILVLSLTGLNSYIRGLRQTKGKSQEVSVLNFSKNSGGRQRQNAAQSAVFVTAKRVSAIYRILLSLCSLRKNMCVNYFYSPGSVCIESSLIVPRTRRPTNCT